MLRNFLTIWVRPFVVVLTGFLFAVSVGRMLDRLFIDLGVRSDPRYLAFFPPAEKVADLVSNTLDFTASITGIAITVASILVQLSATRYSSRVIDLFVEDRTNQIIVCLLILAPLHGFWVAYTVTGPASYPTAHLLLFKALNMSSLLLLIPYFTYLFHFLRPEHIVARIQSSARLWKLQGRISESRLERMRADLVGSVTQLSDVVLSSMTTSDMHLALLSIGSLKALAADYLRVKPAAPDAWFHVPRRAFLGLDEDKLERLEANRTWVEMHCLKQYELVFVQALNKYREVNTAIVQRTRDLGIIALKQGDTRTLELIILFFNTYLRHAMNAGDIRTMFHTFFQYRLLAEGCLKHDWRIQLKHIATHFKYYGQQAESRTLSFAMEIAAYDLRILVERAFTALPPAVDDLLAVFLEVDHVPETTETEASQRGVRKNQAILAAFFLANERRDLARLVFDDMRDEDPERMNSIEEELREESAEEFWEIQERGSNFYFVPPEQRSHLHEFFSWFDRARSGAQGL